METDSAEEWRSLEDKLGKEFGEGITVDGILFLIGVQELGKGFVRLKKDQKLEAMHVAVCRVLEPYGFYEFEGRDEDGWPHYRRTARLPFLNDQQQEQLLKEAILDYFRENDIRGGE